MRAEMEKNRRLLAEGAGFMDSNALFGDEAVF